MRISEFVSNNAQPEDSNEAARFSADDFVDDSLPNCSRYTSHLYYAPPAIENQGGDDETFHAAHVGKTYGLSEDKCFELMWLYYNPRCLPPWSEPDLREKVKNAYGYSKSPIGIANAKPAFGSINTAEAKIGVLEREEQNKLKWVQGNKNGDPASTMMNGVSFCLIPLRTNPDTNKSVPNELYRLFRYNQFSNQIEFTRPAPWHKPELPNPYWQDSDVIQLRAWLARNQDYDPGTSVIQDAIVCVSNIYAYHPVRNYLNALEWDGKARLDTFLIDYLGAPDSLYTQTVGKCVLMAAVARVFKPGCQHDSMLILEGVQGTGKTSAVRILGGDWYNDIYIDPHARDTIDAMQGSWFIEASELEYARRTDAQAMKRFLTITKDRCRLAYARNSVTLPRQSLFIGTVNPGKKPSYLEDTDGNRRFWPVATGQIDLEALKNDRDQLFAEAVVRFKAGENWHLDNPEVIRQANNEAMYRVGEDAWKEVIGGWLDANEVPDGFTTTEIAYQALSITPKDLTKMNNSRISRCLEKLGFERKNKWHGKIKGNIWVWIKSDTEDLLEGL